MCSCAAAGGSEILAPMSLERREGERRNVLQSDTTTNSCGPSIKSGRVHAAPPVAVVCLIASLPFVS
ncbi:uncharacterized [Tachysurus ichikawai]